MNIAYIECGNEKLGKDYCGEGVYELVFNDEVIGNHHCSNRSFANHDLTVWRLEELNKYEIDKVVSNGEVVWERDNAKINNETNSKFILANKIYEAKNCY